MSGRGCRRLAEGLEREQQVLLEAAPLEQTYRESLAVYVQAKHDQVERTEDRLETVREIKEGMGLHSPQIAELATRKMRAGNPELASDWDAMREAARRHRAMAKKQEQEREQGQERSRGQTGNGRNARQT